MRIGIDARFLTHPQQGGFKTYTVNLIKALSQINNNNHYVLYLDRKPTESLLPQSDNFSYRTVSATLPVIGMALREQILLRGHFNQDKLDLAHFLCNTAPVRMPKNFILSLLDVIQVTSPQNFPTAKGLGNYRRWAITAYSKWSILNTVQAAKRVITLSHYEKDQIVKHLNIAPERICVTYFGVNPIFNQANSEDREMWRAELRQKKGVNRRFIMGVGYEPRKNIPLLIEAFSQLAPGHPDLDLIIVAAEKERRLFFQQLAAKLGLNSRIIIFPTFQPSDLAILYNLAEVFVFPSERESFGAPPLEALACGVPTIAMNMTSLPEVLADGAILVDGKDPQTWAKAIEQVLVNEGLRKDLISRGRKQAATLTWQRCAQETLDVYCAVEEESRER